jgi:hypothetical protein
MHIAQCARRRQTLPAHCSGIQDWNPQWVSASPVPASLMKSNDLSMKLWNLYLAPGNKKIMDGWLHKVLVERRDGRLSLKSWGALGDTPEASYICETKFWLCPLTGLVRSAENTSATPRSSPIPCLVPGQVCKPLWHSWLLTSLFPQFLPTSVVPAHIICGNLAFYRQKKNHWNSY